MCSWLGGVSAPPEAAGSPASVLSLPPVARPLSRWRGVNADIARIFGLTGARSPPILSRVDLPSEGIVLVRGFSGTGKSTLLDGIRQARPDAMGLGAPPPPERSAAELLPGSVADRVRSLGRVGLGEALAMVTPSGALSVGQRHRLRLALLLARSPRCVVIDEFLSGLDELTASVVAWNFQKLCRRAGVTAYLASAQDHILEALAPDHLVTLDFHGHGRLESRPVAEPHIPALDRLWVGAGTAAQMRTLSRFHYESDTSVDWRDERLQVRVAAIDGLVVGGAAFGPPLPQSCDRVPVLAEINRQVIRLVRTIVHPVTRGVGLTRRLLPEVHEEHRLLCTMSAMGRLVPFHLAHGFELVEHPRSARRPSHDRLDSLLAELGVSDPAPLFDITVAQALWQGLGEAEAERLLAAVGEVIEEDNVFTCTYLARHAGISLGEAEEGEIRAFFCAAIARVPPSGFGLLLSEALFFPMQGAVKRVGGP